MLHELRAAVVAILRIALAVAGDDARVFLGDIERFEELARGEHAKSLLIKGIQPVHDAAGIHVPA